MALTRLAVAGLLVGLVGLLVLAARRRRRDRDRYTPPVARLPEDLLPGPVRGELAVVGFSSRFCVACRRTPDVASEAIESSGVDAVFAQADVRDHTDLADTLALRETPTVILVDPEGRIRYAREGNPDPGELAAYLQEAEASPGGDPGLLSAVEDAVRG